jgi:hypothetical protein
LAYLEDMQFRFASGSDAESMGAQLLALTARAVIARGIGLYLWVLEQNVDAQAFYEACGARRVERALASPPGGVASRLNGTPAKLRYAWSDPAVLLGCGERAARMPTSSYIR